MSKQQMAEQAMADPSGATIACLGFALLFTIVASFAPLDQVPEHARTDMRIGLLVASSLFALTGWAAW